VETIGDRIKKIREKKGMTQERLADACDISKGFLSDVENNKRNIGSQKLLSIANTLGASLEYLLRGAPSKTEEAESVVIPPELSQAAEELHLSYSETLDLINAYKSVVARRADKFRRDLTVEEWKKLHRAIKETFG
jgi:transcriptional regulator with XRE-family HTH domain